MTRRIVAMTALALLGTLPACSSEDVSTVSPPPAVEEAGDEARETARKSIAELRTDAERFIDDVQTRNAPEAKQQLLDRCRDALERVRKSGSADAERVEALCNRIQDSDMGNASVWSEIRQEIEKLR